LRCKPIQRIGCAVDKRCRIRIRDDVGQCAVEVQADERLPAVDDADQLTIRVQRVRQLRHGFVPGAHLHIGEVGNYHVGAVREKVFGMTGAVDTDNE
jgi:hypothetical protein